MSAAFLDARGMACPLPVLRARKVLKTLPAGGKLLVEATDPSAPADFVLFCRESGYGLEQDSGADGVHRLTVTVPALASSGTSADSS